MRFHKYHALGNDYIVMDPADFPGWSAPTVEQIRVICHRNFGAGSDGILWGPLPSTRAPFGLRIFNPDGSEAEKSGNGLRIFCRYLYDQKKVTSAPFKVDTLGGVVDVLIEPGGRQLTIDMGHVSFDSAKIPVTGPAREVVNEKIQILDREFTFTASTIGNPHCVIPLPAVTPELAHKYGPHLETHA
ncbi:MAG: diaminopimelate epimerase, partial [Oleiharenicola lentus]